ncbi:MAG: hypothetical protein OEM62_09525 [Acidobacteriota bacterium]|nr:hypothetical protein [Acidobacteriota bacterium]
MPKLYHSNVRKVLRNTRRFVVLSLLGTFSLSACADNATKLRFGIEREAGRLGLDGETLEIRVPYEPVRDNGRPYWLIFMPRRHVSVTELIGSGLDETVAIQLFQDLSYVEFGDKTGPNLVVWQDGRRLAFTGTASPRADRVVVARKQGRCDVVLQRRAATWKIVGVQ